VPIGRRTIVLVTTDRATTNPATNVLETSGPAASGPATSDPEATGPEAIARATIARERNVHGAIGRRRAVTGHGGRRAIDATTGREAIGHKPSARGAIGRHATTGPEAIAHKANDPGPIAHRATTGHETTVPVMTGLAMIGPVKSGHGPIGRRAVIGRRAHRAIGAMIVRAAIGRRANGRGPIGRHATIGREAIGHRARGHGAIDRRETTGHETTGREGIVLATIVLETIARVKNDHGPIARRVETAPGDHRANAEMIVPAGTGRRTSVRGRIGRRGIAATTGREATALAKIGRAATGRQAIVRLETDRGPIVRHAEATGPGRRAEKARENRGDPEDRDLAVQKDHAGHAATDHADRAMGAGDREVLRRVVRDCPPGPVHAEAEP